MKLLKQIMARVIFLPLILAAGVAATAMFTIKVMFKPADLEAIVTNQFQQLLKRPVQIEWARMSYTGEIKVKGLRVTEPGPETMNFIEADYIYATYRWLPLLKRRIEIDSVVLVSPSITLLRRADGSWNVGDIFAAYRTGGGRNLLNKIDSAEVKDGRLSLAYMPSKARYTFENFNATLTDFEPGADTPFYASVFFKSNAFKKPVTGRIYAEGRVNFAGFNWTEAELKDLRADLTLQDKTARFTGGLKNFRRPELKFTAETPLLRSSDLAYLFKAPFNFTAPRSSWEIAAVFTSSKTVETRLFTRPLNIKAEGAFDLSKSTLAYAFTVSAPPVKLDQLKRYGAALPVDAPSGQAQLRLRVTSRNAAPVLSRLFINTAGAGFKYHTLSVSGLDGAALLSENFANSYANAARGRLVLGRNTLAGLKLKTDISKSDMLFNYSGKFNATQAKGRILVKKAFSPERTLDFAGYSHDVIFADLKALILDIKDLLGPRRQKPVYDSELAWMRTLKNSIPSGYSSAKILYKTDHFKHDYFTAADFYLSSSLKEITGDIATLRGDVAMRSGSGTFYDVQRNSEKDRVFYIFSLPLTFIHRLNRTGALKFGYEVRDVSFSSIGGDYSVADGKVQIRNFYMEGKEFSAHVTGSLDFSNETMNVKIYTISGKYYSMGSLPEALTDASGKPALAFTLAGKMADPEFKMISPKESSAVIKEAARRGVPIDFARIDSFAGGKK